MIEQLKNASIAELAEFLRQRCQMRGPMAADLGTREMEFPYDLPLKLWQQADATQRRDLAQATAMLVEEIPGPDWSAEAVEALATFIDLAEMVERLPLLQDVAESGRWLEAADDGPRCHMVALRTLLDLGWKGTPDFWRSLPPELNERYPALAFRGLLAHDTDAAFAFLPHLACDPRSTRRIVNVLSSLVRELGSQAVCEKLRAVCARLPGEVVAEFERWFRTHKWGTIKHKGVTTPVAASASHRQAVGITRPHIPEPAWDAWPRQRDSIELVPAGNGGWASS